MIDLPAQRIPLVPGDVIERWSDPEIEAYFRHSYVVGGEEGTRTPGGLHAELIDPRIVVDDGRAVKTIGDGIPRR